jgi:hypothetical protein
MALTNFPNGISSFGVPVLGSGGIPSMFGDVYFVDDTNGDDTYDGKSTTRPFKTLNKAYTECTTSNNDVIVINGTDPVEEDSMLTWSKNKIHVVGLGAFGATDQSPRIIFSTTGIASDSAAVIKVTGWANTFTNVRINCWGTHANNVTALWDAGEATTYTNCQFNKFTDLGETTASNVEARGDSTTWRNCKFGFDTLEITAARPNLRIKGTGGSARMKNNYFENCYWVCDSSDSDGAHVLIHSTNSLAFSNVMVNPIFLCSVITSKATAVLDNAIDSVSGLVEGNLLVVNPATNCTAICATVTDRIQVVGPDTHATAGAPNTPS